MQFENVCKELDISVARLSLYLGHDMSYLRKKTERGITPEEDRAYADAAIRLAIALEVDERLAATEEAVKATLFSLDAAELVDASRCIAQINAGQLPRAETRTVTVLLPILRRLYDRERHPFRI